MRNSDLSECPKHPVDGATWGPCQLSQLYKVSLSTTRIDPLLEGLRLIARFCGSSFCIRATAITIWYNRGPLTPNGSEMTVAGHFHLLHLSYTRSCGNGAPPLSRLASGVRGRRPAE